MSQESEFRVEMLPSTPVVPVQLWEKDKFRFHCHKGIACFNKCCENADILLTPWDVVRLARHFGISTREAIDRYTVDYKMDGQGMPGLKLARKEGTTSRTSRPSPSTARSRASSRTTRRTALGATSC